MTQALSMRENTARPALETIQANNHELHAAKVVQLLANMDRFDVDNIIGIATKQLHELSDRAVQKALPKYLINKKEENAFLAWRRQPNGPAPPTPRVLTYNEVIAKSGDWRGEDELPDYHLRRIQAQHDWDIANARNTAAAQARAKEVVDASRQVAVITPVDITPTQNVVVITPAFDIESADKEALRTYVQKEFNYDLDTELTLKVLREQARELVRQKSA